MPGTGPPMPAGGHDGVRADATPSAPVSAGTLALAVAVIALGATVQGAVGFGQALISAPLLLLIDARLVPGPATVAGLALNLLMLTRDHGHADHVGLRWAVAGLVPGTLLAMVALAVMPDQELAVAAALLVLAAVAISASGLHPRVEPRTLAAAGTLSGLMATTAAIGGPPMALVYQRSGGPALRATLSRFFCAGAVLTLFALVPSGRMGPSELAMGLLLVPGAALGFVTSKPLVRHVDPRRARVAVLVISALSGTAALLKAVL